MLASEMNSPANYMFGWDLAYGVHSVLPTKPVEAEAGPSRLLQAEFGYEAELVFGQDVSISGASTNFFLKNTVLSLPAFEGSDM